MAGEHQYWFKREKVPAAERFPLKRADLDPALAAAGVFDRVYSVRMLRGRAMPGVVVELLFTPEGARVHAFAAGRSLLTVWSVPAALCGRVEAAVLEQGLPLLCAWLAHAGAAGDAWRGAEHRFALRWQDGVLTPEGH